LEILPINLKEFDVANSRDTHGIYEDEHPGENRNHHNQTYEEDIRIAQEKRQDDPTKTEETS
jgi:hypothetical protein